VSNSSAVAVIRAAAVQMTSSDDVGRNLATAERLVRRACELGADLVVLPEKWHFIHDTVPSRNAAVDLDGELLAAVADWAATHEIAIVAGSVIEKTSDRQRAFNTSVAFDRSGATAGTYRKLHLFDVDVGGRAYCESDGALAGDEVVVCVLDQLPVGLSICYDLRFPELYRAISRHGALAATVPAAFTATTGKDHWEPLVRARAIENQMFVIAAGQVGRHANGTRSHGRSMIVDPWGIVLAQAGDTETVVVADLDLAEQQRIRSSLPALTHRRLDVLPDGG
jgi:deaminated glutathione amidase